MHELQQKIIPSNVHETRFVVLSGGPGGRLVGPLLRRLGGAGAKQRRGARLRGAAAGAARGDGDGWGVRCKHHGILMGDGKFDLNHLTVELKSECLMDAV